MKWLINIWRAAVIVLPWVIKRQVLIRVYGYQLDCDARIGYSYIFPERLSMKAGATIGHLNVAIHLDEIEMMEDSTIGRGNWITGHPKDGTHFKHKSDRRSYLRLGAHSAITKSHLFDCTDQIVVGEYSTVAGYGSQFVTHGISVEMSRQDCRPIRIGSYCMVGTRCIVLGGGILPDRSVLAAGAVLTKEHLNEFSLYSGVPAQLKKNLDSGCAYFQRSIGYVD